MLELTRKGRDVYHGTKKLRLNKQVKVQTTKLSRSKVWKGRMGRSGYHCQNCKKDSTNWTQKGVMSLQPKPTRWTWLKKQKWTDFRQKSTKSRMPLGRDMQQLQDSNPWARWTLKNSKSTLNTWLHWRLNKSSLLFHSLVSCINCKNLVSEKAHKCGHLRCRKVTTWKTYMQVQW